MNTQPPQPSPQPDHDLHSSWGCTYTSHSPLLSNPTIKSLSHQYTTSPSSIERKYHQLLGEYTELFAGFFRYWPISLHAHATDALLPTTVASLVLNTVATSPLVLGSEGLRPRRDEKPEETGERIRGFALEFLGWNERHVEKPNFVAVEGIYGAGFGPLAHTSKEWEITAIASGPKPVILNLKNGITPSSLDAQLAAAKSAGCIAIVFDMVSTEDGSVLPPSQFRLLKEYCAKHRLLIIVDETMTAIRCGAPFAFQRGEYRGMGDGIQPDLVIFGKGVGVSGVGMGFQGAVTRGLAYEKREDILQTILYWRALVSRPVRLPVLIEALGILYTARAENWPARSEKIGQVIRGIVRELVPETREEGKIRGLGAMIALHRDVSMRFRVMSAIRRRSDWVRWLPKLDAGSADREALMRNVFGEESKVHRGVLASEAEKNGTMPLWCFICGIQATEEKWCRKCFLGYCTNEVCEEAFGRHVCV